jgi:glutaredoxin-related protein
MMDLDFVGGCDIVLEMHVTGELAELIASNGAKASPCSR